MHLSDSSRAAATPVRLLQSLALAARGLVAGLAGLLILAFTLLAGLIAAGVLLVVALVARRRLQRGAVRFAWKGRTGSGPGAAARPSRYGRGSVAGVGEIVDAEVREIRD